MSEDFDELFDPSIDKDHLDDEWVTHPKRVEEINKLVAQAEQKKERIKFNLDITEAELDKKARQTLSKTTETAVSNWIQLQPDYQELQLKLIDANYEYKMILARSTSFNHRKTALEFLSRLWLANYYVEPYEPEAEEKFVEKQIEKQNSKATQSMLKRIRGRKIEEKI
jgi:hypothetical protein